MADLSCFYCGEAVPDGVLLCPACGGSQLAGATVSGPLPSPSSPLSPAPATSAEADEVDETAEATCPRCGAGIPDPANLVCVECLVPFDRAGPATPADEAAGTRRDVPRTLLLVFPGGRVLVRPGGSAVLGRAPDGPHAAVFGGSGNVSRRHAVLGVDPNGAAWVLDEGSVNGTYVNDVPAGPGVRTFLHDGDVLRLAADVEATVRLTERSDG